jgi:hypothetical protein
LAVTVAVAVAVAVEPVGFDGFFSCIRALCGRIMRMGMVRITRMGALCVRKGVRGDREKDPPKKNGCAAEGGSRLKEKCQWKKKIKKSFKIFSFSC